MALVKYIGPSPAVTVPSAGGQQVTKGSSIEVTSEEAASLLMSPTDWEAGDEATKALTPHFPAPVSMISGFAGIFDLTTVYSSGVMVEEGGIMYLSVKASVGETPRLAFHVWQSLGPIAPSGLPGVMMPIVSLGSPLGGAQSTASFAGLVMSCSRMIVPKTGLLKDIAVYNYSTGKATVAVALYDTGQVTNGEYTKLGESAHVTQGEALQYQSFGDLGKPPLVAGQHVVAAVLADKGGIEFARTTNGPGGPLPAGYLPGSVPGDVVFNHEVESMAFPAKLPGPQEGPSYAVHVIASIA